MNLTLKDRIIILNMVLPQYASREDIILKKGIVNKLSLSNAEEQQVIMQSLGSGQFDVGFKTEAAIRETKEFDITDKELLFLKKRVEFIDQNGMFSEDALDTYDLILNTPIASGDEADDVNKEGV